MIDNIYDQVRAKLINLKLKEAPEYFDKDNVPDSLTDRGFCIGPIEFDIGDRLEPRTPQPRILNIGAIFKIFLSIKLPANKWSQRNKDLSTLQESIIRNILSIEVGSNEIDDISYTGSSDPIVEGNILIAEVDFRINYRAN